MVLPESPATAAWLTDEERTWIQRRIAAEKAAREGQQEIGLLRALAHPLVLILGICNLCVMSTAYAFSLSAPAVLTAATGWDATTVGLTTSWAALFGAVAMVLNGWHSDRMRERHLHVVVPLVLMACAFATLGAAHAAWLTIAAYAAYVISQNAVQAAFWLIPSDALHGRLAAIGVAAIGSIGMLGAFVGPYVWGLARDYTGGYQVGLFAIAVPPIVAAAILLRLKTQVRNSA